ncbi:hypothetical protein RFI_04982 [Reticulomyxa filosa]|uniref:Uncharacterized protein n=1 Tax=Reticulomyxa filosa TaxID=46433 RepID=X6MKT8_RETFI|nr:hypothetical protein RFI_22919 [Reticulomyxa filosa]ETO32134.1 hypothetical protein RFI_04982 [Reticulomyxa filosa]|eukprot:ETO14449.1 hypothetical protein RFI_22919 [Reticulomyxa filosa]
MIKLKIFPHIFIFQKQKKNKKQSLVSGDEAPKKEESDEKLDRLEQKVPEPLESASAKSSKVTSIDTPIQKGSEKPNKRISAKNVFLYYEELHTQLQVLYRLDEEQSEAKNQATDPSSEAASLKDLKLSKDDLESNWDLLIKAYSTNVQVLDRFARRVLGKGIY